MANFPISYPFVQVLYANEQDKLFVDKINIRDADLFYPNVEVVKMGFKTNMKGEEVR